MKQPKWLVDDKEAAQILGISRSSLRRWRLFDGQGPRFIRISAGPNTKKPIVRYDPNDLQDWISAQETGGARQAA